MALELASSQTKLSHSVVTADTWYVWSVQAGFPKAYFSSRLNTLLPFSKEIFRGSCASSNTCISPHHEAFFRRNPCSTTDASRIIIDSQHRNVKRLHESISIQVETKLCPCFLTVFIQYTESVRSQCLGPTVEVLLSLWRKNGEKN